MNVHIRKWQENILGFLKNKGLKVQKLCLKRHQAIGIVLIHLPMLSCIFLIYKRHLKMSLNLGKENGYWRWEAGRPGPFISFLDVHVGGGCHTSVNSSQTLYVCFTVAPQWLRAIWSRWCNLHQFIGAVIKIDLRMSVPARVCPKIRAHFRHIDQTRPFYAWHIHQVPSTCFAVWICTLQEGWACPFIPQ